MPALIAAALVVLVVVAFHPVLGNDFVNWDDDKNFLLNLRFRGLGPEQLRWAWTTFLLGVYQPIAWMLLGLQYVLWGMNPAGYHAFSMANHALNAVLMFALCVVMINRTRPNPAVALRAQLCAGAAVAVFAVHPLRAEVVAWASCQPYLPCATFCLLAILAYLRAHPPGGPTRLWWLVAAWLGFLAALLCKAAAVSLPVVLLVLDFYVLNRLPGRVTAWLAPAQRRVWLEKLPFLLLAGLFMIVAVAAKRHTDVLSVVNTQSALVSFDQIAIAAYGIWFYLLQTVVPTELNAFYRVPYVFSASEPRFVLAALGVAAVSLGAFVARFRWPLLIAVWAGYLVTLAPTLGLVRISAQMVADRYCYIPLMVATLLLCARPWALPHGAMPRAVLSGCAGLVVLALVTLSVQQSVTWRNSVVLWTHALRHGPVEAAEVHTSLGVALGRLGDRPGAEAAFRQALRIDAENFSAYFNLGVVLAQSGALDEAERSLLEGLRRQPQSAEAHGNLGSIAVNRGRFSDAIGHYAAALRIDPDSASARRNLGVVLDTAPDLSLALRTAAIAILADPTEPAGFAALGEAIK